MNILKQIALFLVLSSSIVSVRSTGTGANTRLSAVKNIACLATITLAAPSISTITHELGHALIAKILTGAPINIHLGLKQSDIVELGNLEKYPAANRRGPGGFTFHSWHFWNEACSIAPNNNNIMHETLIRLAGPVTGIITLIAAKKLLNKLACSPMLKDFVKVGILDHYVVEHVMNLTPFSIRTDGYKTLQRFGVSQQILDTLSIENRRNDTIWTAMYFFIRWLISDLKSQY